MENPGGGGEKVKGGEWVEKGCENEVAPRLRGAIGRSGYESGI